MITSIRILTVSSFIAALSLTVGCGEKSPSAIEPSATVTEVNAGSAITDPAWGACATCHGNGGQGNAALNAPALAGLDSAYVARQLHAFRSGVRGSGNGDSFGAQMAPMAAALSDQQIESLAAAIAAQPALVTANTVSGDVAAGKAAFIVCGACHGPNAEGNAALNSPALTGLDDWYLQRQLQNFRNGARGSHPEDKYGKQMRPMAEMLADEQAINDVVAYIDSL